MLTGRTGTQGAWRGIPTEGRSMGQAHLPALPLRTSDLLSVLGLARRGQSAASPGAFLPLELRPGRTWEVIKQNTLSLTPGRRETTR